MRKCLENFCKIRQSTFYFQNMPDLITSQDTNTLTTYCGLVPGELVWYYVRFHVVTVGSLPSGIPHHVVSLMQTDVRLHSYIPEGCSLQCGIFLSLLRLSKQMRFQVLTAASNEDDSFAALGTTNKWGANTFLLFLFCVDFLMTNSTAQSW